MMEEMTFSDRFAILEPSDQTGGDYFDPVRVTLYAIVDTKDIEQGQKAPAVAYCKTWADATFTARFLNFADAIREEMKIEIKGHLAKEDQPE